MSAPKIVVFAGSVRTGSINQKLVVAAAKAIETAGGVPTAISLKDYALPLYDGDLQSRDGIPEAAKQLVELFLGHQGAFIASPEYNASFSPLLKNALDWMSRVNIEGRPPLPAFKQRVFALGAVSNGAMGGYRGLTQLRSMMELGLGALVLPEMVAVGNAAAAFADDGGLANEKVAALLAQTAGRLVETAGALA
ncbi:NADPH-dependent FMN reductase [Chenggangzhangella methanolivorans]|uniref:NAD(P)H-dependent oxidoreductase n=1 Tax=Chenggangzhangella methanolivorans TaxID=1437009 RepID=A0A9E6UL90_9HYPH|nr:NAD(P)H-dependent oxidoreductase [Chenggangzhangella methanolivorans]QZN98665.1 NAD(P)H-dependent oxidoreductase [Chenggangzhangella methanolivorans]